MELFFSLPLISLASLIVVSSLSFTYSFTYLITLTMLSFHYMVVWLCGVIYQWSSFTSSSIFLFNIVDVFHLILHIMFLSCCLVLLYSVFSVDGKLSSVCQPGWRICFIILCCFVVCYASVKSAVCCKCWWENLLLFQEQPVFSVCLRP